MAVWEVRTVLRVKKLNPEAVLPTVAHPGEDLGYDIYALQDSALQNGAVGKIRTGIAVQFPDGFGGIVKDRSSMASKGITVSAGVVDAGYRGEILVLMTYRNPIGPPQYDIRAGEKIAQIVPVRVHTEPVMEVTELSETARGEKGFGSSGN